MQFFSKNLKYLRKENSLTQAEIKDRLSIEPTTWSNYEREKSFPNLELFHKISKYFGVSETDLLNSDLSKGKVIENYASLENENNGKLIGKPTGKLKPYNTDDIAENFTVNEPKLGYLFGAPKVIVARNDGNENIIHVPVRARAGYLNGYGDTEFMETLPSYSLPGLRNATFRSFEVEGHSMKPTLLNHDYIVGEWCENADQIREGRVHIIVTHTMGVVIKRVLNRIKERGKLYLKSDNIANRTEYPTIEIDPEEVKEIWYARLRFTPDFSEPGEIYTRINDLEIMMFDLNNRLNSL